MAGDVDFGGKAAMSSYSFQPASSFVIVIAHLMSQSAPNPEVPQGQEAITENDNTPLLKNQLRLPSSAQVQER